MSSGLLLVSSSELGNGRRQVRRAALCGVGGIGISGLTWLMHQPGWVITTLFGGQSKLRDLGVVGVRADDPDGAHHNTRMSASITAYSAISCPFSSIRSLRNDAIMLHLPAFPNAETMKNITRVGGSLSADRK
jgi:hypothetical protein